MRWTNTLFLIRKLLFYTLCPNNFNNTCLSRENVIKEVVEECQLQRERPDNEEVVERSSLASPGGNNIETDAGYVGSDQNLNFSGNSATLMLPFKRKNEVENNAVVHGSVQVKSEKPINEKPDKNNPRLNVFRPISVWNTNFYDWKCFIEKLEIVYFCWNGFTEMIYFEKLKEIIP